jgi:acyl dehydratase
MLLVPKLTHSGEQAVEVLHSLPTSGKFINKSKIIGFYDKGKGAVMVQESMLVCAQSGTPYVRQTSSTFIRGIGGFGGDKGPSGDVNVPPKRLPDAVVEDQTCTEQAKIYRLSGDYNPLHVDPEIAKSVGFEKPMYVHEECGSVCSQHDSVRTHFSITSLHGLCTFGFAARAILKKFCNNDTTLFKSIAVRFARYLIFLSLFMLAHFYYSFKQPRLSRRDFGDRDVAKWQRHHLPSSSKGTQSSGHHQRQGRSRSSNQQTLSRRCFVFVWSNSIGRRKKCCCCSDVQLCFS